MFFGIAAKIFGYSGGSRDRKVMHAGKCFQSKYLFSVLLCLALSLSLLPVEAFAKIVDVFEITNNEGGYIVSYPDGTADTTFATFAEALASCKEKDADLCIVLGGEQPLSLNSSPAKDAANKLVSGTYQGSVVFTYMTDGDAGFVVPSGAEITFSGLTVSNAAADFSAVFTPVAVERGATLNLVGACISSLFSYATNNTVVDNSGILNMSSGTVSGDNSAATGIRNNAGGELHISGGTVSSEAGYYATGILNYGLLTISGTADVRASSCGIFAGGDSSASVTISNGTVAATEIRQEGAVYLPEFSQATVTVSGGILQSADETTLRLAEGDVAGGNVTLYGLTLHQSSMAGLVVTGVSTDSVYTINAENFGGALVTATDFSDGHSFAAWSGDSAGENTLSEENGKTVLYLSDNSNEHVYLQTQDEGEPWLFDGNAVRTADTQGTVSFISCEAGTYYYKVVPYCSAVPDINPDVPDSYDGTGQTAAAGQVTTVSAVTLSSGMQDVYFSVLDAAGNLGSPIQLTFLPAGVSLEGSGQTDDPYLIGTADELMLFATGVYSLNDSYALTADIDMAGRVWRPVGAGSDQSGAEYNGNRFYGKFFGNNFTISNLEIDGGETGNYQGFIAYIETLGEVRNLNLSNASVAGKNHVGVLAGFNKGVVTNCSVTGGQVVASGQFAGGLIGQQAAGAVDGCTSSCTVSGNDLAGGMFGLLSGGIASRCSSLSAVMTTGGVAGGFAGKIVPDSAVISLQNCYSTGSVSGISSTEVLGGFVGQIVSSSFLVPSFLNCYAGSPVQDGGTMYAFYGALAGSASMTGCYYVSDAGDQFPHAGLTGLPLSEMAVSENFAGWDFTDVWTVTSDQPTLRELMKTPLAVVAPGSEAGTTKVDIYWKADSFALRIGEGDGAPEGAALPSDAVSYQNGDNLPVSDEQLEHLTIYALNDQGAVTAFSTLSLYAHHVNIFDGGDGSAQDPYRISTADQMSRMGDYSGNDNPRHFILVNDIDLEGFVGSVPEKRSLDPGSGWAPVRFFGSFDGNGKTIRNLTIDRPDSSSVGLFKNLDDATVRNLAIVNASVTGSDNVGILIGNAYKVHIEQVSVSGSVSGRSAVGGLAGRLGDSPKTVLDCYSTADVRGGGALGGLVGHLEMSAIKNSYAASTLTLEQANIDYSDGSNRIRYCDILGGLLGDNVYDSFFVNTFASSYYDTTVSGRNDETGAEGKTTAQMKTQSTYIGWDFTSVWAIDTAVNSGYPYLRSLYNPSAPPASDNFPPVPDADAPVIVNGVLQNAGTASNSSDGHGRTVTAVTVDTGRLDSILRQQGEEATVVIPVTSGADVAQGIFTGQAIRAMEQHNATLVIRTGRADFTLPASGINITAVSELLGQEISLSDITVEISIAEPPEDMVRVAEESAGAGGFAIIVPPLEFKITCSCGERTVEVSRFNAYAERLVSVLDGVDPNQITIGIVVEADGTLRHVPTQIILIDGKYYAKINSLTNSVYSVIYNHVEFKDVTNHWAKGSINDMGSRMVLTGIGSGVYEPERLMTRAEFAVTIVRALGIAKGQAESSFEDVALKDWFNGYVGAATEYQLIAGYDSSSFGPNDTITREQAMSIVDRAMKLTGLDVTLTKAEVSNLLSAYVDGADISAYATEGVAACLKTGIITGRSADTISPKACVTRAEVAVMVQRLLQESGLI